PTSFALTCQPTRVRSGPSTSTNSRKPIGWLRGTRTSPWHFVPRLTCLVSDRGASRTEFLTFSHQSTSSNRCSPPDCISMTATRPTAHCESCQAVTGWVGFPPNQSSTYLGSLQI